MSLAVANSVVAIEEGANRIDSSLAEMGAVGGQEDWIVGVAQELAKSK